MQGHLLKYKNKDGEWVPLPIAVVDVYNTYVAYCTDNNITPVDKTTYYTNLGNLQTLTEQLAGSADAITDLSNALAGGVLPLAKGGTGRAFDTEDAFIAHLQAQLEYAGFTLSQQTAISEIVGVAINEHQDVLNKINKSEFGSGTVAPGEAGFNFDGTYYFQYKG